MTDRYTDTSREASAATSASHGLAEAASPASSTSTLRAAPTKSSGSDRSRQLSKGQMARKQVVTDSVGPGARHRTNPPVMYQQPYATAASQRQSAYRLHHQHDYSISSSEPVRYADEQGPEGLEPGPWDEEGSPRQDRSSKDREAKKRKKKKNRPAPQQPLLGGLYFSDLIVVAFFYALNLLRTCGLAELIDVAFKATTYVFTRLPIDFYQRWSLSRYPSAAHTHKRYSRQLRSEPDTLQYVSPHSRSQSRRLPAARSRDSSSNELTRSSAATTSDEEDPEVQQLSPFHHLVILLTRFACSSFPHLLPRVLFAEETIGPLVRWRTGGGAAGIVKEFTDEQRPASATTTSDPIHQQQQQTKTDPIPQPQRASFRAFWIGADAHVPVHVRRSDPSSRHATTLLYLHGGGFSLGSVAFYAEALIRIMSKISQLEQQQDGGSRCIAVEYDLSPSVRFPAPLLQCLRCYAHLVEVEGIDPASITLAGDSAGANLAMSMLLCIDGQASDEPLMDERDWSKLPMPGKAVLISPWADLRPSGSLAFAGLRERHLRSQRPADRKDEQSRGRSGSSSTGSIWTEAMAQYEWDYVAAETLLHFAQVYAGVLEKPRRVRGPMGWVANLCGILTGEPQLQSQRSGHAQHTSPAGTGGTKPRSSDPLSVLSRLVSPPTRLAKAAHTALTEPLLDLGIRRFRNPGDSGSRRVDAFDDERQLKQGGLDPLFPREERISEAVASTADLFIPPWTASEDDSSGERQSQDPSYRAAVGRLDKHILISPALGDWSRIRLAKGMLVTWGERELLSDDIEAWAERIRKVQRHADEPSAPGARGADTASRSSVGKDDRPSQDGLPISEGTRPKPAESLQERRAASRSDSARPPSSPASSFQRRSSGSAQWFCTAVEHGPSGVHAWPFVSMYLAGSEAEREKGLELIARFVATPSWIAPSAMPAEAPAPTQARAPLSMDLPARKTSTELLAHPSPPHHDGLSPVGSLPSDVYDDDERHYMFHSRSREDSVDWDSADVRNELGLRGLDVSSPEDRYPPEPMWTDPTPTPSTGANSPMVSRDAVFATGSWSEEQDLQGSLQPRLGLGLDSPSLPAHRGADYGAELRTDPLIIGDEEGEEEWESDEMAAAKPAGKKTARKRSNSAGKRKQPSSQSVDSVSSASSFTLSTTRPAAPNYSTARPTEALAPDAKAATTTTKLDPVHLRAPYADSATSPATRAGTSRPNIPKLWCGIDADEENRQVAWATVGKGREQAPSRPAVAPTRTAGLTLADIEALEEAEEAAEAAAAAASHSSDAGRSAQSVGAKRASSRLQDPLDQILGSAYESDPDEVLEHDDSDLYDLGSDGSGSALHPSEGMGDGAGGGIGGGGQHLSSLRYVDDGSLSPSPQGMGTSPFAFSMDPGFYGLSSYSTARPEGLSDIAEEDSQFDTMSSIGGVRSPPVEFEDESEPENERGRGREHEHDAMVRGLSGGGGYALTPGRAEMARLRSALEERERMWRMQLQRSSGGRIGSGAVEGVAGGEGAAGTGADDDADADADADLSEEIGTYSDDDDEDDSLRLATGGGGSSSAGTAAHGRSQTRQGQDAIAHPTAAAAAAWKSTDTLVPPVRGDSRSTRSAPGTPEGSRPGGSRSPAKVQANDVWW